MTHRVLLLACVLMALSTTGSDQEAEPVGPSVETGQEIGDKDIQPTVEVEAVKEHHEDINPSGPSNEPEGAEEGNAIESNAAVDIKPSEPIEEDHWNENSAKPREEVERERRDLHAQESMARSATSMVYVAIVSTVLTGLALFFIWLTYLQTKRAADYTAGMLHEARLTTEAARKQIEVTQRIAEIQTRAFLTIESAEMAYERGRRYVRLILKNIGNSPARHVEAVFLARSDSWAVGGSRPPTLPVKPNRQPLTPAMGAGISGEYTVGLTQAGVYCRRDQRTAGLLIRRVEMIVEYQTEFDVQRSTVDRDMAVFLVSVIESEARQITQAEPGADEVVSFPMLISEPLAGTWMDWYRRERGNEPGKDDPTA
ncbi:MAG: hypothetical protein AAF583_15605 [Pseudomonadota bacterium]